MRLQGSLVDSIRTGVKTDYVLNNFETLYKASVFPPYEKYQKELLINAIISQNLQLLNAALERGYLSSFSYDYTAVSPLHFVCHHEMVDIVRLLLKFGADVDQKSIYCWPNGEELSALEIAMEKDNVSLLQMLLPFAKDKQTLLHTASAQGGSSCVKYLLSDPAVCAYINYRDSKGDSPLLLGVQTSRSVVELLLGAGADVFAVCKKYKQNSVHKACKTITKETPEILKALLSAGVNATAKDYTGSTALDILLDKVTWPCHMDYDTGRTCSSQTEISLEQYYQVIESSVELLIEYGLKVDSREEPKLSEHYVSTIIDSLVTDTNTFCHSETKCYCCECLTALLVMLVENGAKLCSQKLYLNFVGKGCPKRVALYAFLNDTATANVITALLLNGLDDCEKQKVLNVSKPAGVRLLLNSMTQDKCNTVLSKYQLDKEGKMTLSDQNMLRDMSFQPRSLQQCCRVKIQLLLHKNLVHQIKETGLPNEVEMFVLSYN